MLNLFIGGHRFHSIGNTAYKHTDINAAGIGSETGPRLLQVRFDTAVIAL